jgi:integrase
VPTTERIKPRVGYLFRRWRGKHIPIDTDLPEATIYLCYQVQNRRKAICLHTSDRAEADRKAANIMGRIKWGPHEDYLRELVKLGREAERELAIAAADGEVIPLDDAWQRFVNSRRRPRSSPAMMRIYRQQFDAFRTWAQQAIKSMRHLTPTIAEQYVRELEKRSNPATIAKHCNALALIWRVVDPAYVNPWLGLRSTATGPSVTPYRRLTGKECRALYRMASGEQQTAILAAYYTGLRLYDVVHLSWDRADPGDYCVIDMHRALLQIVPRKTARAQKRLAIPAVGEWLAWLRAVPAADRRGLLFPVMAAQYDRDAPSISREFAGLFQRAKVVDADAGKASFHSLRKTFVSLLDEAGVHVKVTDALTGHASAGTMHDRYSQVDVETARRELARALPGLRGR